MCHIKWLPNAKIRSINSQSFIGAPSNIKNQGRQPSLGNISASKRESDERNESRFVGAKKLFSSLSGMTESGSANDEEYYEQDYEQENNRVTRYWCDVQRNFMIKNGILFTFIVCDLMIIILSSI